MKNKIVAFYKVLTRNITIDTIDIHINGFIGAKSLIIQHSEAINFDHSI